MVVLKALPKYHQRRTQKIVLKAANTAEYKLNEVSKGGKDEDEPEAAEA